MNIRTVADGKVYRGPYASDDSDWKQLKDMGIRTVLNLESGLRDEVNEETEKCLGLGMTPIHVNLSPLTFPTTAEFSASLEVLNNANHHPVYVHCYAGVDRTGAVCAAYRVEVQHMSVDDAIKEWKDAGMHSLYFEWIREFKERYNPSED